MLQVDVSGQDTLSDEVVVYLDVLGLTVEVWVMSEVNIAHIIVVQGNQIRYGNDQIVQYPFLPNGFTGGNCSTPVFNLYARECDCRLLFAALGCGSAAEA